jgi:hypothetical protein
MYEIAGETGNVLQRVPFKSANSYSSLRAPDR